MADLTDLVTLGQSAWIDYLRRGFLTDGAFSELLRAGVRGVTSNPTILEAAIDRSADYDRGIEGFLAQYPDAPVESIYEALALEDVRLAADLLYGIYADSDGEDGYVSLEVSPLLAHDRAGTVAEGTRLYQALARPNVMIKVPATEAGVQALEDLIALGVPVNATLLFAVSRYEEVARAYRRGVSRLLAAGGDPRRVASVASFFVSRVDTAVDRILTERSLAPHLLGKIAIANAALAYRRYQELVAEPEWRDLERQGARRQRLLWASTSTKNPSYRDVYYVEELIAPETVNTMPPATLAAFRDHGRAEARLLQHLPEADQQVEELARAGVDLPRILAQLLDEGLDAFAQSFAALLRTLEERLAPRGLTVAAPESALTNRLAAWESLHLRERLQAKDPTLFGQTRGTSLPMGWLSLPEDSRALLPDLERLKSAVMADGFQEVLLLGMGGSSLAPDLLSRTFPPGLSGLRLTVLDSTHPDAVRALAASLDWPRTLVLVSSKSGSTTETLSLFAYAWERVRTVDPKPGRHFVAITDPGSPLDALAAERDFRAVFHGVPSVGGRYSALSAFGLVPAHLLGLDVNRLLADARHMAEVCQAPATHNPGLALAAWLTAAVEGGRDKLTFLLPPALLPLGAWLEQLIAESLGKAGKGILPVVGEPEGSPDVYGEDRAFVRIALEEGREDELEGAASRLAAHGWPVARYTLRLPYGLGREFYRWELAVAALGAALSINAFDQPNVEAAKEATRRVLAERAQMGRMPPDPVDGVDDAADLLTFLKGVVPGHYIALQAYLPPSGAAEGLLRRLQGALRDRYHVPVTAGFGPRFLHSTGQFHKGGPATGHFVQILSPATEDLPIPGAPYSFGELIAAQALGDAEALRSLARPVFRLRVRDFPAFVDQLLATLAEGGKVR